MIWVYCSTANNQRMARGVQICMPHILVELSSFYQHFTHVLDLQMLPPCGTSLRALAD